MKHSWRFVMKLESLKLPGWDESSGVAREIEHFKDRGIEPVFYEPLEFGITPHTEGFAAAF